MGKTYLIVGAGHGLLSRALEIAQGRTIIVTDKAIDAEDLIEVLDIFKAFPLLASLPSRLSPRENLILDLYAHASRLSALSNYASVKMYLRLCEILKASAKAKCFNLYITYCGERTSWIRDRLRSMVDEEVLAENLA